MSEVLVVAGAAPDIRYIELWNEAGGCLFPTTHVQVFDGGGRLVASVAPVAATTCFDPGTYFLLATSAAAAFFGVAADHQVVPALPANAGQVCVASSGTRYDCVRWGAVTTAVRDFFAPDDASAALAPPRDVSLARVAVTHVVAADWILAAPTPRGVNDGEPYMGPDAGVTADAAVMADAAPGPDAGEPVDAGVPDARVFEDARPRPDARGPSFLDLDPVGGASCGSCASGQGNAGLGMIVLMLGVLAALRAILHRRRPGRS